MSTELSNGVIIPEEYSDDWYDEMSINLRKLNDVITAASDNATDIQRLDTDKANSADLATVATSGSYNDLSNKPSIPTKTSDLTNDSNFVDTSNSAVASGITSAKVTSYDSHIADTDIHVTTADKTKWNNNVTQSYVFRYSSTALVASSTNSNTLLDNTDNLKVGDKVIDSSGVLFSITAIDTANSTFTVGSALVDLALDANVVHTNRNDDVSIQLNSTSAELGVTGGTTDVTLLDKNGKKLSGLKLGNYVSSKLSYVRLSIFDKDVNDNEIEDILEYSYVSNNTNAYLRVYRDNFCTLGSVSYRWKGIYATNYYYGSDNVEFSTKFVTSDTAQTITEIKTFANTIKSKKEIEFTGSRLAYILPEFSASYSGLSLCTYGSNGALKIGAWKVDDNDNTKHVLDASLGYLSISTGSSNSVNIVYLTPKNTSDSKLGDSTNKWKQINGLTPSSLGMPNFTKKVDIAGYISNLSGSTNNYTPTVNGWLYVGSNDASYLALFDTASGGGIRLSDGVVGEKYACIPCQANRQVGVKITCTNLTHAYFVPCLGNI